jgi:hypothetical protein
MSLIRFLRATRSLEGSQDIPSPYRLPEQNLLPKFGSPARGRTRAQEDIPKPDPKDAGGEVNLSATAQTKTRAMEGKRTWMFWRNWFAPKPQKAAAPVQEEFALDEVKVVRNDLADADLEVVAKSPKKPKAEAVGI